MSAIEVHGLTKRFGGVTAVDDLSFELEAGTVTGLLGANGAGKTTTLRMLLGLVTPTAGRATFGGRRYTDLDEPARQVGAVLEASSFHPGRRALDHLRIVASAIGLPEQRASQALDHVGLAADARRRVGGFSLGMRQRLGLAAALLGEPSVLILDEPANGLDPEGVHWLRGFMRDEADARSHRVGLEPPARRSRPDGRSRRDHEERAARDPRPARRADRPRGADRASFVRPTPSGCVRRSGRGVSPPRSTARTKSLPLTQHLKRSAERSPPPGSSSTRCAYRNANLEEIFFDLTETEGSRA